MSMVDETEEPREGILCVCMCARIIYLFIYLVFLPFLGLLSQHMEVPRLGA